ncbi:hypothetical protein F5X98DRAFT_134688 [Xylaria grammica]|nr:hypothetical protein F5X98DRAFT_134688 [Xylaria grammica]
MNALSADKRSQLLRGLLTPDGADFGFLRHTIAVLQPRRPWHRHARREGGAHHLGEPLERARVVEVEPRENLEPPCFRP